MNIRILEMNSTAIILKGISATGKGTRVSTLLEFLKSRYAHHSHMVTQIGEFDLKKPMQIGVYFPRLRLFFLGGWVKSNKSGLISWSSLDGFSSYNASLYYDISKYYAGCNIVMEGYFGGKGDHVWPSHLGKYFKNVCYFHYLYTDLEELQERCVMRSGKRIKGSCWGDNRAYLIKPEYKIKDVESFREKFNSVAQPDGFFSYTFHPHDELPVVFGRLALKYLGLYNEMIEFKEQWLQFSTLRRCEDKEDNHAKYMKYLKIDSDYRVNVEMYKDHVLTDTTFMNTIWEVEKCS